MSNSTRLATGPGPRPLKVLLTEDDEDDYVIVRDLLREETTDSYRLTWASSVEDAVDKSRIETFDAVVSDFFIGPETATDLIRGMSQTAPGTPVIVISGKRDDRIDPDSLRAGASAFLTKSELSGPLLDKTIRYVVERHRLFTELQDSELRFRTLIDNGPVGFIVLDEMRPVFFNPAAAAILGVDPETGFEDRASLIEFVHKEERQAAQEFLQRATSTAASESREFRCVAADGRGIICDFRAVVVPWAGRRLLSVSLIDVTERHETEQRLRQAQRREAVMQLTGGIAHDFNNKLAVIIGNLDLLTRRIERDEKAAALIDRALRASDESRATIAQLLAYTREQLLEPQETDANSFVADVVRRLRRQLDESIEIDTGLYPDILPMLVDQDQLEAALVQLARNSCQAMPDGGVITFEVGALKAIQPPREDPDNPENETPQDFVTITVSDTGSGIPDEIRTRVFDPFFTTAEFGERSGLGLSMVQGFTRQSGGFIEVDSTPGKGTSITLAFPRAR